MTRKTRYLRPLMIGFISFALSAIVTLNVRSWLLAGWEIEISEVAYRWIAYAIMAIAFYLVMPPILKTLRSDTGYNQWSDKSSPSSDSTVEIYRYPIRDVCLYIVASATVAAMPFIYDNSSNPWKDHPFAFIGSALLLVFSIFGARTYVRIDPTGITLSGSWRKKHLIPIADIANVRGSIRDKVILIDIRSGGTYTVPGQLENFPRLVKTLKARFGHRPSQQNSP